MKKNLSKLFAMALALIMTMALTVPAMAANTSENDAAGNTREDTGSITIVSTDGVSVDGHVFKAYRVLDVTFDGGEAYSYTVNSNFADFTFDSDGDETDDVTAANLVEYLSGLSDDSDALKAISYELAQYGLTKTATATATGADGKAEFSDLAYGYYVIYPDDGTAIVCAIDTVVGDVTINVKNEYPTLDKEVTSIGGESSNKTSGNIGDTVGYSLTTAKVPDVTGLTSYTYEITDTMSEGLTFNDDVAMSIGGISLSEDTDFTVSNEIDDETGETNIIITITDTVAAINKAKATDGYNASKGIVTTYSATINRDAEVYDDLTNSASLKYGNNQNTVTDEVAVETYDFDFRKYTDKKNLEGGTEHQYDDGDTLLANAVFKLTATDNKDADGIEFVLVDGVYYVAAATDSNKTTNLTSISSGTGIVNVRGLKAGTYYLWETAAPEGYNVIAESTEINVGDAEDASVVYNIYNGTGTELPETGGMGTTLFYTIGGVLVVCAGVLLVTKKRMHDMEG